MEKIETLYLHTAIMIPNSGRTEKTLANNKVPGLEMWYGDNDVVLKYKGALMKMPKTNVALAILEKTHDDSAFAEPVKTIRRSKSGEPATI